MLPVFSRAARGSVTGCCSDAPRVSALTTAIPSMAERWISGTEYRAKIGRAVIFPDAPSSGVFTTVPEQENSRERSSWTSSSEITFRYRFTIFYHHIP